MYSSFRRKIEVLRQTRDDDLTISTVKVYSNVTITEFADTHQLLFNIVVKTKVVLYHRYNFVKNYATVKS